MQSIIKFITNQFVVTNVETDLDQYVKSRNPLSVTEAEKLMNDYMRHSNSVN
jgi:hypothetical protein